LPERKGSGRRFSSPRRSDHSAPVFAAQDPARRDLPNLPAFSAIRSGGFCRERTRFEASCRSGAPKGPAIPAGSTSRRIAPVPSTLALTMISSAESMSTSVESHGGFVTKYGTSPLVNRPYQRCNRPREAVRPTAPPQEDRTHRISQRTGQILKLEIKLEQPRPPCPPSLRFSHQPQSAHRVPHLPDL
jgi:hypothetical protein